MCVYMTLRECHYLITDECAFQRFHFKVASLRDCSETDATHHVEDLLGVWHISAALTHIFEYNSVIALIFHSIQYLHSLSDVALVICMFV